MATLPTRGSLLVKRLVVIAAFFAACSDLKTIGGGWGIDLPGFDVARECLFEDGRTEEWCSPLSDDELAEQTGADVCYDTPRHSGPCYYHCDGGRGCNALEALNGCWCP